MIRLSPEAVRQLDELSRYYVERGRDKAIDNLVVSVERASARYAAGRGLFYDAPRPYPTVRRRGWRWTKEGRYWLAFAKDDAGPVIAASSLMRPTYPGACSLPCLALALAGGAVVSALVAPAP